MTPRRTLILLAVAFLVIGAALWLANRRDHAPTSAGAKVLPALAGSINDVTEVRVVTAGGKSAVTLKRDEKFWRVAERAGYRADAARLRKLLIGLSELQTVEEKTANPENYARLGVEDPAAAGAASVRIDVVGLAKPASLIVGKSAGGDSTFVRLADNATSLQAKPTVAVEREPRNWLDRSLIDVAADRVQQVRVTAREAKPYEVTRDQRQQADFAVPNLPRGKTLSSPAAANPIAAALAGLTLDDVRRAEPDEEWTKDVERAEYRLFDGTTVTVTGRQDGDKHLVRIALGFDDAQYKRFSGTPAPADASTAAAATAAKPVTLEDARSAAQTAGAHVEGWVYEIPAYKYETLFQPLNDLLSN